MTIQNPVLEIQHSGLSRIRVCGCEYPREVILDHNETKLQGNGGRKQQLVKFGHRAAEKVNDY
jgi:hypothetical protein